MHSWLKLGLPAAYAVSVAIHLLVGALFLFQLSRFENVSDETLTLELNGMESDVQLEERVREQNKAAPTPSQQAMTGSAAETPSDSGESGIEQRKPNSRDKSQGQSNSSTEKPREGGIAEINGGDENQNAQTIQRQAADQVASLRAYARNLSKKIRHKLVYPSDARRSGLEGVAIVSVRILRDGAIQADSLKLVSSSGQTTLDESALQTIRVSAPFPRPPSEFTVQIAVTYDRKR